MQNGQKCKQVKGIATIGNSKPSASERKAIGKPDSLGGSLGQKEYPDG